jgi:hypothetical protein
MSVSRHQNASQNRGIKIGNRYSKTCHSITYLGMTVSNQNLIEKEIKNFGNACYRSVQNSLQSCLTPKNEKIQICKTIILHVVLYGCETWFLRLREELRLRVFENSVPRRIFGPKRVDVTGGWRKLHN